MKVRSVLVVFVPLAVAVALGACSSADAAAPDGPGSTGGQSFDGGPVAVVDSGKARVDGGFQTPDGAVLPSDRFASQVVSFTPGECAGFGIPLLPDVVLGPPVGAGDRQGSLDVVSLGAGGSIVLGFAPTAIVDGPGPDFIVFENAFFAGGDPSRPFAEPAEVSVSDDGITWRAFPCATSAPWAGCAGTRPVLSAPDNGVSPFDPEAAGGDAFDLATVGLARARYVKIVDRSPSTCPAGAGRPNTFGFDLDAVAILHR